MPWKASRLALSVALLVTLAACGGGGGGGSTGGNGGGGNGGGDKTPPSVPTNLAVTNTTSSSISLGWTASTDNVGVAGYYVYRNDNEVGNVGTTSFTDTGLTPNTSYTYTVAAYDAAGNVSAQSSSVTGTTLQEMISMNAVRNGAPFQRFYSQNGAVVNFTMNATGLEIGDALHFVFLGEDSVIHTFQAGDNLLQFQEDINIDTDDYSPSFLEYYALRGDGTRSNNVWIAFVGNQQTLVETPNYFFQLDQAQLNPSGGYVYDFLPDGAPNGNFLVGQPIYGIAAANDGSDNTLTSASNGVDILDSNGNFFGEAGNGSFSPMAVAAQAGAGCTTEPSKGNLTCFTTLAGNNPGTSVSAGSNPFSLTMTNDSTGRFAYSYDNVGVQILKFQVTVNNGLAVPTLVGGITLPGITSAAGMDLASGGWKMVDAGGGVLAFLSEYDQILVFVDESSMTELGRITLTGNPFQIAANPSVPGQVVVSLIDSVGGNTDLTAVTEANGVVTETPLTSVFPFLSVGTVITPDGKNIAGAGQAQLSLLPNQ